MTNDLSVNLISDKIKTLIRFAAQDRFRTHSRIEGFNLVDVKHLKTGQVLGNWMSLILVTGNALKITQKLHFSHKDIKTLIHPIYRKDSASQISDQQSMDFVKELSNLTAGYLAQVFEDCDVPLGISLPLGTRGFYEVFADYTPSTHPLIKCDDLWCLEHDGIQIYGSVIIEITDITALKKILSYEPDTDDVQDEEDDGDFDFL